MNSINPEPAPERACRQYCFGEFTLDLTAGFLRRGVEEVTLRPKSFAVLAYLVEHHGSVVSKSALLSAVWPDAEITDNSLAQCLLEIRRALADDAQQLVRTIKGRGYVFTAIVQVGIPELPRQARDIAPPPSSSASTAAFTPGKWLSAGAMCVLLAAVVAGLLLIRRAPVTVDEPKYVQLTDFTDSAVAPVLSPDGRMVAFLRSENWFLTSDQIYVKMLPHGEPVQVTNDPRPKCCMAFSPDGSRIAYTSLEPGPLGWKTYTVSSLGGEPTLLLSNATGLTWLDPRRLLFSEIGTGLHMGIVMATETRSAYRKIYFPPHERAMAHYSYASPDRQWALVVEMDPDWKPCRLIQLVSGGSDARQVGPQGSCTSAGWSPNGKWMYFSAEVGGQHHLWRQRFPSGDAEQITFGPTAEEGIAVAPDGRSLITSIGMQRRAVWIHDARGERPLSSEGHLISSTVHGIFPKFSADGKSLFYLIRRQSPPTGAQLWRTHLESGRSEQVLADLSISEYDVSPDGNEVVFSTQPPGKASQIWLAPLDRRFPPRLIASAGESLPHFGPERHIIFQFPEEKGHYVGHMNKDGSGRSKVAPYPVAGIQSISADRRWIVAVTPVSHASGSATMAIPAMGGPPRRICDGCPVAWAPDGRFLYVGVERNSRASRGKTLAIPVPPGQTLPKLPTLGIRRPEDRHTLPGSQIIEAWDISPGPDPSMFAYTKTTVHRNLFRIPLRND